MSQPPAKSSVKAEPPKKTANNRPNAGPSYRWSELQELIFLDRYARKGSREDIKVGDTVVVMTKDHPRYPQKDVGVVEEIDGDDITVRLRSGELFTQKRSKIDLPLELTPEDMWDRMARAITEVEAPERREELEKEFRWLLQDWRFVPGGRINAMLGANRNLTAYNCYVIPIRADDPSFGVDSRRAIMDTLRNMVEIMSRGGGVGINVSPLRPRLSYVQGVNGKSSGSVSWGALFSFATGLVEQGGSRRGALMLILECWHPDVIEFINAKRDMSAITNANISVGITDDFERALKEDADWQLVFPDYEAVGKEIYDREWDGNLRRWKEKGYPVRVYDTIKARDLWKMLIDSAWASAEPGIVRIDYANRMSNSYYFEDLISTNPCVTGDTLIYTDGGLKRAEDLFFEDIGRKVVVDGRLSPQTAHQASPVFLTGRKPVVRVTTREGYEVRTTSDHLIMTEQGWKPAGDLQPGDKVHILNRKGLFGTFGSLDLGRALGWLMADQTGTERPTAASFAVQSGYESIPAESAADTAPFPAPAAGFTCREALKGRRAPFPAALSCELARARSLARTGHQVPKQVFEGCEGMQKGFLQALFTAGGSVHQEAGHCRVSLTSPSASLLKDVQRLLVNFGIFSRIEESHHLVVSGKSLIRFRNEIGFMSKAKEESLEAALAAGPDSLEAEEFLAHVESVTPDGVELVYDLTEPVTHSFVANGVVVHNCAEQFLPPWGVCNLGHINLSRFVRNGEILWDELGRTARLGVRFLDNIIDYTPYFFEENERVQKNERRIGMGTMGLGELLIHLGVKYGSPESLEVIDRLYKFIATEAYMASVELAKEKGPFPMCDPEKFVESGFMKGMPEEVREAVRRHGIRNVCLLTQAPTGTTGTMVGTSTGIEPYYQWTYYRKGRLGTKEVNEPIVQEWFEAHPEVEPKLENLPDYFVTALDLTPEQHVRVQAAIQRWVDSSISKTCNVPSHWTPEQVDELYRLAWELGCKGITIYRDKSRDEQVLVRREGEDQGSQAPETAAKQPGRVDKAATIGEVPEEVRGLTYRQKTMVGTARITVNELDGEPFETIIVLGKGGMDITADSEAIGRLISLYLRTPSPIPNEEKLALVVEQLRGIGGAHPFGFGPNKVLSLPDALAKALERYLSSRRTSRGEQAAAAEPAADARAIEVNSEGIEVDGRNGYHHRQPLADLCPSCGSLSYLKLEGCGVCRNCGYSTC